MSNELLALDSMPVTTNLEADIRGILHEARRLTVQSINHVMVLAYWEIGKRIVNEEAKYSNESTYGKRTLEKLSKSLTDEFGNGFSYANLRNMRQFYTTYPNSEICYTVCSKLSWSHNRLIMRLNNAKIRLWYLHEAYSEMWSVRQLERNIRSGYYERTLNHQNPTIEEKEQSSDSKKFVKDPYILEFLGVTEDYSHKEKLLESRLIDNMQQFLLELGKGFSFVKRQYRISTETTNYYIDLVFYNYILKCFILVDLKAAKLTHQDVGQMDMYIRMFDDLKKGDDDNPTIGILMCAERDETVVKYSVLNGSRQIFASKYLPYLPSEEELRTELERRIAFQAPDDEKAISS